MKKDDNAKQDAFKRLAENRVNNCLNTLRTIGNLSGSNYDYTPEQVEAIFGSLTAKVAEVEALFNRTAVKRDRFSL